MINYQMERWLKDQRHDAASEEFGMDLIPSHQVRTFMAGKRIVAEPMFEAACSGLRYSNPGACGEISAIHIDGVRYPVADKGKRIVEDVPVAYRWYTPRSGMWDEHVTPGKPPLSEAHMVQPLYAAPSDAEVGND